MTADARAPLPVSLAPLRRSDIPRCVEIEHLLFPGDDPWSAAAFRAELNSGAYYLGAYDGDGALLGYGGLAILGNRGNYETEVHTIGVVPQWQGYGIGRGLLAALLTKADDLHAPVFLEVRTDNDAAVALYEKNDFARVGERKGYYQPSGADAYTMRRPPVPASVSDSDQSRGEV